MNEREAAQEARRRNLELGAHGKTASYWIEVPSGDGSWRLEFVDEELPPRLAALNALKRMLRPWRWLWVWWGS